MADSTNSTGRVTYRHRDLEVACNLGAGDVGTRMGEWRRLREEAGLGVERIEGGVRLWLDARSHGTAADLARRESECCGFLDFDLVPEGGRDRFDITSAARSSATTRRMSCGAWRPSAHRHTPASRMPSSMPVARIRRPWRRRLWR